MDIYTVATHETLDRIGRACPRAISAFIHLICRADNAGKVVLQKKQIINDLSESYTKFRNDIRALARESVLEWHQMGEYLHITLAIPKEFSDGD